MEERSAEGVLVPCQDSTNSVHILPEELPQKVYDDVMEILQAEWAKPRLFIRLAEEYHKLSRYYPTGSPEAKKFAECAMNTLEALVHGVKDPAVYDQLKGETEEEHARFDEELLTVYNMLAGLATQKAMSLPRHQETRMERQRLFETAKLYLDQADGVRRYAEQTLLSTAWTVLNVSEGTSWKRSDYYFTNAKKANEELNDGRPNLMAMLGMGIMAFHGEVQGQQANQSVANSSANTGKPKDEILKDAVKTAKRLFAEVIRQHPKCPASVRVAYGLCCYRLGDYPTASYAFKRALVLEHGNKEALLGLVRTTLMQAKPEDYAETQKSLAKMLASAYNQDQDNACACNSMAKYYLSHWKPLDFKLTPLMDEDDDERRGYEPGRLLRADTTGLTDLLKPNTLIRLGDHFVSVVDRVEDDAIVLKKPYQPQAGEEEEEVVVDEKGGVHLAPKAVYKKDLEKSFMLAERARNTADFDEVKAESYYIMARVFHQLEDLSTAAGYYREAVQLWPELDPAQYGLAQMLAHEGKLLMMTGHADEGQKKLDEAIQALERVLARNPNDPDTLHMMGLLYADVSKKVDKAVALDKLKKAIDAGKDRKDTWIALAQVHQREPPNLVEATKCYKEAERLMVLHKESVPFTLYHNLGTLSHHSKDLREAKDFYLKALTTYASSGAGAGEGQYIVEEQRIVHPANSVFWKWEDLPGVTILPTVREFNAETNRDDWRDIIKPGDHIRLKVGPGPRDSFVTEVEMDPVGEATTIKMKHTYLLGVEDHFPVSIKRSRGLLRYSTLATVFNLAIVQEELGETEAAMELLQAIIRQYPSYTPAYARLALMLQSEGKNSEAIKYIHKAREIAPNDKDLVAIHGKLDYDGGRKEPAQEKFNKLNMEAQDPFSQIALGNMYFTNAVELANKPKHMTHALTFFQKCLKKEPKNVYAAHGLALTFAERNSVDDAYQALTFIREKSPDKPEEVLLNLAHVDLAVKRKLSAIHAYQTWLRRRAQQGQGLSPRVLNYLAHAYDQAGEYDKGVNCLLKTTFIEPDNLTHWFNLALLLEHGSLEVFKRAAANATTSADETKIAMEDMERALVMYERPDVLAKHVRSNAKASYLRENRDLASKYVVRERDKFQREEEKKQELQKQAQEEEAKKQEQKRQAELEARARRDKIAQDALARQQEFERMQIEWQKRQALQEAAAGKRKGKKKLKEDDELEESDVEEGGDEGGKKAGKQKAGDEDEEEGDETGGESSEDEEYGMLKKEGGSKSGKKKGGKKKIAKGGQKKGVKGEDAAGRKRKVDEDGQQPPEGDEEGGAGADEANGGKKKRRLVRDDDSDEEEEELDLDLDVTARNNTTETSAAEGHEDSTPPMDVVGDNGDAGQASTSSTAVPPARKRVVQEEEEDGEGGQLQPMEVVEPEAGGGATGVSHTNTGGEKVLDDLFESDDEG